MSDEHEKRVRDRARVWISDHLGFYQPLDIDVTSLAAVLREERAAAKAEGVREERAKLRADVRRALNEACVCGGRGPDDDPCPVCDFWHRLAPETKYTLRNPVASAPAASAEVCVRCGGVGHRPSPECCALCGGTGRRAT